MPLQKAPSYRSIPDRFLEIAQPGIGGLNLKDLEFEQEMNQSPYMMNMMYRNGAFSKRYGQQINTNYEDTIYAAAFYRDHLIVHAGEKIYSDGTEIASGIAEQKGLFCKFTQKLYYFCDDVYEYDGTTWGAITPYIPNVVINRHPDPADDAGDVNESYNMLGTGFSNTFDGDNTSTVYKLTDDDLEADTPKAVVNEEEWTYDENLSASKTFKLNRSTGEVTFNPAPPTGVNNVEITAYKKDEEWTQWHNRVLASKYYAMFGGNNNSRLFLAGNGESLVLYTDVYDATYIPYVNYIRVGNGPEDVTGFGNQYNILCVFKPDEIYSLQYYINTENTTTEESQVGLGAFSSMAVNNAIGCDCPGTIQLINSQLAWLNSRYGVCILASTNIQDERNVRPISRNIDKTSFDNVEALLDWADIKDAVSADFDGKYFVASPASGKCFVWDYTITPYANSGRIETDAKRLCWYYFDNIYASCFLTYARQLFYISSNDKFAGSIIQLNSGYSDLDFNQDGEPDGINAYYMTPFLQFGAVEYLKNVKNIYVQCRGDTSSVIDMYYYTEESSIPEQEAESIRIGGRLWNAFNWQNFQWLIVNWANTFRRKCSLKKIQMASFFFVNVDKYIVGDKVVYRGDEAVIRGHYDTYEELIEDHPTSTEGYLYSVGDGFYLYQNGQYKEVYYDTVAQRDMSISHVSLQYSIVKNVK